MTGNNSREGPAMIEVEINPSRIAKDGDEVDAFSRKARRALKWQRGEVRGIKTRAIRRNRRQARQILRDALS
jgi:hypothetical protein